MLWRAYGRLHVTVVAKARLRITADDMMTVVEPEPVSGDELVPFRAAADVVVSAAHACAMRPVEAHAVRLAMQRHSGVVARFQCILGKF